VPGGTQRPSTARVIPEGATPLRPPRHSAPGYLHW
jgi:hypothetical protein